MNKASALFIIISIFGMTGIAGAIPISEPLFWDRSGGTERYATQIYPFSQTDLLISAWEGIPEYPTTLLSVNDISPRPDFQIWKESGYDPITISLTMLFLGLILIGIAKIAKILLRESSRL